jgi:hypothetical protein
MKIVLVILLRCQNEDFVGNTIALPSGAEDCVRYMWHKLQRSDKCVTNCGFEFAASLVSLLTTCAVYLRRLFFLSYPLTVFGGKICEHIDIVAPSTLLSFVTLLVEKKTQIQIPLLEIELLILDTGWIIVRHSWQYWRL